MASVCGKSGLRMIELTRLSRPQMPASRNTRYGSAKNRPVSRNDAVKTPVEKPRITETDCRVKVN